MWQAVRARVSWDLGWLAVVLGNMRYEPPSTLENINEETLRLGRHRGVETWEGSTYFVNIWSLDFAAEAANVAESQIVQLR